MRLATAGGANHLLQPAACVLLDLLLNGRRDRQVVLRSVHVHVDVLGDMEHMQVGAELPRQLPAVEEGRIRRLAEIGGDENLFEHQHGGLHSSLRHSRLYTATATSVPWEGQSASGFRRSSPAARRGLLRAAAE